MKIHLNTPLGRYFCASVIIALTLSYASATVSLPSLISDHAVLQRSTKTAVWGKADPGEHISVELSEAKGETTAGQDGKWRIEMDLTHIGQGPFQMNVVGNNKITVTDVLIGEVWVAAGQSNMEFVLSRTIKAEEEIAASTNVQLRQFHVANNAALSPQEECKGTWVVANPQTSGGFTAVGYFFAKSLQQNLHIPVGLINASWGGTPVEAWTSAEALDSNPDLKAGRERVNKQVEEYNSAKSNYIAAFHEWQKKYDRTDKVSDVASFVGTDVTTTDWKPVLLPGSFSAAGLPDSGAVWIRKTVTLHGNAVKGNFALELLHPEGFETVYYNGKQVGTVTPDNYSGTDSRHTYHLSNHVDGENIIAIRLYTPTENAGISGDPNRFNLDRISLKGEWLGKVEYALPPLSDEAKQSVPPGFKSAPPVSNRPCLLYNGMIAPLLPYTIKGTIWYQGENNVGRAHQYQTSFPLMINDWRQHWGWDFPFYFCQLASYQAKQTQPTESAWAELRDAQAKTLSLTNTGEAILIDVGETGDIHPRNKKDAGERLAALALSKTYGEKLACSGPVCDSQKIEGNKIRLHFQEVYGGLVTRTLEATYIISSLRGEAAPLISNCPNSQLEGFAICGVDKKWVWAEATIEGDSVVVSAPSITNPIAVRYAWADSPTANLYNQAGFPAGPFRTDNFPEVTEKVKF